MELKLSDIYQEILWHVMAYSALPEERALFETIWETTRQATAVLSLAYDEMVAGRPDEESTRLLSDTACLRKLGRSTGREEEAVSLVKGVLHYGPAMLKYAHDFLAYAHPANKRPTDEFFRRFVQFVFPKVRADIYRTLSPETWCAYDVAYKRYTDMRLSDLGLL